MCACKTRPRSAHAQDQTPVCPCGLRTVRRAYRLKRVFGIDIETCPACGGALHIIACIEDPAVIGKILAHLDAEAASAQVARALPTRVVG